MRPLKQTHKNGNQESELQATNRPQFRASNIMAHALALYNLDTAHSISQTMSMALRQFLPPRYVAQVERIIRNGKDLRAWTSNRSRTSSVCKNHSSYARIGISEGTPAKIRHRERPS